MSDFAFLQIDELEATELLDRKDPFNKFHFPRVLGQIILWLETKDSDLSVNNCIDELKKRQPFLFKDVQQDSSALDVLQKLQEFSWSPAFELLQAIDRFDSVAFAEQAPELHKKMNSLEWNKRGELPKLPELFTDKPKEESIPAPYCNIYSESDILEFFCTGWCILDPYFHMGKMDFFNNISESSFDPKEMERGLLARLEGQENLIDDILVFDAPPEPFDLETCDFSKILSKKSASYYGMVLCLCAINTRKSLANAWDVLERRPHEIDQAGAYLLDQIKSDPIKPFIKALNKNAEWLLAAVSCQNPIIHRYLNHASEHVFAILEKHGMLSNPVACIQVLSLDAYGEERVFQLFTLELIRRAWRPDSRYKDEILAPFCNFISGQVEMIETALRQFSNDGVASEYLRRLPATFWKTFPVLNEKDMLALAEMLWRLDRDDEGPNSLWTNLHILPSHLQVSLYHTAPSKNNPWVQDLKIELSLYLWLKGMNVEPSFLVLKDPKKSYWGLPKALLCGLYSIPNQEKYFQILRTFTGLSIDFNDEEELEFRRKLLAWASGILKPESREVRVPLKQKEVLQHLLEHFDEHAFDDPNSEFYQELLSQSGDHISKFAAKALSSYLRYDKSPLILETNQLFARILQIGKEVLSPASWAKVILSVLPQDWGHSTRLRLCFALGVLREAVNGDVPQALEALAKEQTEQRLREIIMRQHDLFHRNHFNRGHNRKEEVRIADAFTELRIAQEELFIEKLEAFLPYSF